MLALLGGSTVSQAQAAKSAEELVHRFEVCAKRSSAKQKDIAKELVAMGPAAVPALIKAMRLRPDHRLAAILGDIGDPRAVEPLIATLKMEYARQSNSVDALVKIGPASVQPLIAALRDRNRYTAQNAAKALGLLHDPRAVEAAP